MTEITFHIQVPDVRAYACRLLRKAYLKGSRLVVWVEADEEAALDRDLWSMGQGDFVPHARSSSDARVRQRSPIVLSTEPPESAEVLVNLSTQMLTDPGRFARVLEIVGAKEDQKARARQRWATYKSAGFSPVLVDTTKPKE